MTARQTLGPAALVGARRAAGLTQEFVAERAAMSVRALRALERGAVRVPRRSTLQALAMALDLDATQSASFVDSWSVARRLVTYRDINLTGFDTDALLALHRAVNADARDVAILRNSSIGPTRELAMDEMRIVAEAVEDGVRTRTVLWLDDPTLDPAKIELTALHGCAVATKVVKAEHGIVAFELEFSRALNRGEQWMYSFRLDASRAVRRDTGATPPTLCAVGVRQFTDLYAIEVDFVGDVPDRAWRFALPTGQDAAREDVALLGSTAQVVFRNIGPGNYGIEWTW